MQTFSARALVTLGFSFLLALTAACGGSHSEAKSPSVEVAETTGVGSITPVPSPDGSPTSEPPKAAVVSSDNGSDIIPPFSSSKEPAVKKSPAKSPKKAGGKKKKG